MYVCMYVYVRVRVMMCVCVFVLVGMPLGEWAGVARMQQKLIQELYPERYDMLSAMEFLWWIPPSDSIPQHYYQPPQ